VTTRGRNFRVLNGLGRDFGSLPALLLGLGMLYFDAGILTTFSLAASCLPAADLPQTFRVLAVALVPAPRLVLASASLAQADPRARSSRSGQTAVSLRNVKGARERQLPREKLGENALTFSPSAIKARIRHWPASLSSSREQGREIKGLIDVLGTRTPSAALQTIANAAGSEIGPRYLQADAFSGYDGIYTGSDSYILEVACWAHARRKFFEARSSSPAEASLILEMIRRLYKVEDRARPVDDAARRAMRQAETVPILKRLREELDRLSSRLLPKSALAQAITYALNQWRALCRYTEDGQLTIDNNMSERRLRVQAIGRKNWMFLAGVKAGPRAAVLCTILAGAKRHRLEPWAYLHDVILQLSVNATPESLTQLLPDRWALAHPEKVLSHRLEESQQKTQRQDQRRARRRQSP